MIVIIDYGLGNLGSIYNMLKKIGIASKISNNKEDIKAAEKIILSGVGSFDEGIKSLKDLELIEILNKMVIEDQKKILGICLGMQLFTKNSEEGSLQGLGWIDAHTKKFSFSFDKLKLKVPHMQWNSLKIINEDILLSGLDENYKFYFTHSYHVICNHQKNIIANSNYGYSFVSVIKHNNIYGVQFHPEKSHKYGMKILENFCRYC